MTIDSILTTNIIKFVDDTSSVNRKDKRILESLNHQLSRDLFLTDRQASLLVKIFVENLEYIKNFEPFVEDIINSNIWSKPFRVIKRIKKISLEISQYPVVRIDFNHDRRIRDDIFRKKSLFDGKLVLHRAGSFTLPASEHNIYQIVEVFKDQGFDISSDILQFHAKITEIKSTTNNDYEIFSLKHEKLKLAIQSDIGDIDNTNLLLLHDRRIRYQYSVSAKIEKNSLSSLIATRENSKIFVNSELASLEELFSSLVELRRFPVLFVFDGYDKSSDTKHLENLKNLLNLRKITDVGIYFRYGTDDSNNVFNNIIKENLFNKELNDKILVAGVSNGKLPKFLAKLDWKPKAVVSFTNSCRNNKLSTYLTDVDLFVYYNTKKPIIHNLGSIDDIL